MSDLISRQAAIDGVKTLHEVAWKNWHEPTLSANVVLDMIRELPSEQPDYQEVLGWLLAYHTMSFDLHGRYLPHEVISWLINDFTKEFIAKRGQNG